MTANKSHYAHHLNDVWLMVVAQTEPIKQSDVFKLLVAAGKYTDCPVDKHDFDNSLRHLVHTGYLCRTGIKWHFRYYFDDSCLLRPVSGNHFSKAVDCHIFMKT
jgi:hypothetical protein